MAVDSFARALVLAALDDSEIKSLNERIADIARAGFDPAIVTSLPTTGMNSHTLYLLRKDEGGEVYHEEYLWSELKGYEYIGNTRIDFEDYAKKEDIKDMETTANKTTVIDSSSTDEQYPSAKSVYDLPETYPGYDPSKTQMLKNVNGVLTWVDESDYEVFCVKPEN